MEDYVSLSLHSGTTNTRRKSSMGCIRQPIIKGPITPVGKQSRQKARCLIEILANATDLFFNGFFPVGDRSRPYTLHNYKLASNLVASGYKVSKRIREVDYLFLRDSITFSHLLSTEHIYGVRTLPKGAPSASEANQNLRLWFSCDLFL